MVDALNGQLMTRIPDAVAFAFMPPAIPGLGNSGGFSFWLQDRSGGSVAFLEENVQRFIDAARKRPELAGVATLFSASDPQVYASVDRDKALKQGVAVGDVYQTLQAFLGGLSVNQFNRFGRQWRVLPASGHATRGCNRTTSAAWLRAEQPADDGAALSTLVTTQQGSHGPDLHQPVQSKPLARSCW